eukprot:gene4987-6970_t
MFACRHKFFNIGRAVLFAAGLDRISREAENCGDYPIVTNSGRFKCGENDQQMFDGFVENLNQLHYKNKNKPYVVFETVTHRAILKILDARSRELSANSFEGHDGSACSLLQGAKGIGKSEMLMAFKEYCKIKYPHIIPVYITYSDMSSNESLLTTNTILDIVKDELKSVQIETAPNKYGVLKGKQIFEALEKHEKYVLLLIDEFDELYRVRESADEKIQATYRTCMSSLGDLNWLGNQKTGRFAVLLCGSSASCPLLVTFDADRVEFPLQNHSPHLNGTKYKTRRLPVNPFLDSEVSKQMLAHFLPNYTEKQGKLITFCLGMNPRKYSTLAQAVQEENDMFSAFHYGNHESGISLAGSPEIEFRDKLLIKMREKNIKVFKMIKDEKEDTVNAYKVMDSDWINHFEPLTVSEVKSVWIDLNNKQSLNAELLKKMQQALFFLSDKDQLTFSEISGDGLPPYIYPMSGSQVFVYPDFDLHHQFRHNCYLIMKEGSSWAEELKSNAAQNVAQKIVP